MYHDFVRQKPVVKISLQINAQASHVKMVARALARTSVSAHRPTLALNAQ